MAGLFQNWLHAITYARYYRLLRKRSRKLIWHAMKKGHKVELFDRETDPTNTQPVTEQHPEVVADLLGRMAPYLERDGIKVPEMPATE